MLLCVLSCLVFFINSGVREIDYLIEKYEKEKMTFARNVSEMAHRVELLGFALESSCLW